MMKPDVQLRIEGAMLERLLQLAAEQGAELAQVKRLSARVILIGTNEAGADVLIALCRQYHLDLRILRHAGNATLWRRLYARKTLIAAAICCALISAWFLSRIWMIDISFTGYSAALGNTREISALLDAAGIRRGMASGEIDPGLLEKQLLSQAENYSYIGVRIQGVRLLVEASPEVPAPDLYAREAAHDLVAARDGIVESIEVYAGTACVKPGDTVRAGQVLILGEEDKSKEETVGVAALGEVIARSWFEGYAQGSLTETVNVRSGNTAHSSRIRMLGFSHPIEEGAGFESEEVESIEAPIGGIFLPLAVEYRTHYETQATERKVDLDALESQLTSLARGEAIARIENSVRGEFEIADFWVNITQSGSEMHARAVYEIYTDIAVTRDAQIEEVYGTWNTSIK